MTNILYWNIRQFSIDLIDIPGAAGAIAVPGIAGLTNAQAAQQRLTVILDVIAAAQADIISIVEVQTGSNAAGDLAVNGGGLQAANFLLGQLRGLTPAAEWRMVPPLWLGARNNIGARAETVAVLYRGVTGNVNRYFTGPNKWTGGAGGLSDSGPAAAGNYPANYDTFIDDPGAGVPARNIPAGPGPLYRAGLPENQSAARIEYSRAARVGNRRARVSIYGGFRPPYMTSFFEQDLVAVTARNLTVFSVHSPPNQVGATTLMRSLAITPEINTAPAAGEIKILCGDFNLDFLDTTGAYAGVYAPVTGLGYQSLLPTGLVPPANAAQRQAYMGYFGTHIKDQPLLAGAQASRFLWSNGATPSYYPGYRYLSNYASIDNILVNAAPALAPPLTIMNLVTGAPFAASTVGTPALPAIAPPLGANPALAAPILASQIGPPPAAAFPQNPTAAGYGAANATALCEWHNYGRIYSTSDHFALVTTL
jgi:hypothetical protein